MAGRGKISEPGKLVSAAGGLLNAIHLLHLARDKFTHSGEREIAGKVAEALAAACVRLAQIQKGLEDAE